ncbi:hypothetical protein Tco_0454551 [Tanacetum coccineum]
MEHFRSYFCNVGGNNAVASDSASKQAQQPKPDVVQHVFWVVSVVVIGLSAAGGQPCRARVSVGSQNEREMGDGIPTQSSATGGASDWSIL